MSKYYKTNPVKSCIKCIFVFYKKLIFELISNENIKLILHWKIKPPYFVAYNLWKVTDLSFNLSPYNFLYGFADCQPIKNPNCKSSSVIGRAAGRNLEADRSRDKPAKVHILWEALKILRRTKVRWRFRKILRLSQNMWTLPYKYSRKDVLLKLTPSM